MRLDLSESIAGVSILRVRHFLKWAMRSPGEGWQVETVMHVLKTGKTAAQRLIEELETRGLVEKYEEHGLVGCYRATIAGHTLAMAKASKPITRATAERVLREFLDRCERVNSDPAFPYSVRRCILFGSYLSKAERIGDVDLALDIRRKPNAPRVNAAHPFAGYDKVCRYLKSRSRALSLHALDGDEKFYEEIPHKVVFEWDCASS